MSLENNKRIAKNTLILYFRMGLTAIISLYTSRIVLKELGVDDFGVYSIVGGMIGLLMFINTALSQGTQRFINFYIDSEEKKMLNKVFSASFFNHIAISIVIFILAETIGLWFVNEKLVISGDRIIAANWVYQFSIISSMFLITQVPYNATIIAHEKMNIFAYISFLEVTLRLIIVYLLSLTGFDKLIFYSFLLLLVQVIINLTYRVYCNHSYPESKVKFHNDFSIHKNLFSFSSWTFIGGLGYSLSFQGVNILLNLFFGPVVNAARGIAFQVNGVTSQFMNNFQMAINPQLVKNYASDNKSEMFSILFNSIKFSLLLTWLITFPVIIEMGLLLKLWLVEPPKYTDIFCQLILVKNFFLCFESPLNIVNGATGKNRNFNLTSATLLGLSFPISYLFLKLGFGPAIVFGIDIIITFIMTSIKSILIRKQIQLSFKRLFFDVIKPFSIISSFSFIPTILLYFFLPSGIVQLLSVLFVNTTFTLLGIYIWGINKNVRLIIVKKIKSKF